MKRMLEVSVLATELVKSTTANAGQLFMIARGDDGTPYARVTVKNNKFYLAGYSEYTKPEEQFDDFLIVVERILARWH